MLSITDIKRLLSTVNTRTAENHSQKSLENTAKNSVSKSEKPDLKKAVAIRLHELDKNDVSYERNCRRAFLEMVLVHGLNDSILEDPRLEEILSSLEKIIMDSPDINKKFNSTIISLIKNKSTITVKDSMEIQK